MIIGDPGVGKTTIILDLLSNIRACNPGAKVLFISAEMNEIDLAIYVQRFPKFQDLDILFIEADFNEESPSHNLDKVKEALQQGWDVVAVDSFFELQSIVKDEEDVSLRKAETMLLSLIKQQNKGENDRHVNTTFLTIQQVTKSGRFIGTNRLKHAITAMLELRLENPKNVYSDRYAVFSKHRRGDVGVRLYYDLSSTGDVSFNEEKFLQDRQLRKLQSTASSSLRNFADQFDKIFNGTRNGKTTGTDEGIES
jgi:predicted ATP-dependent serine protease